MGLRKVRKCLLKVQKVLKVRQKEISMTRTLTIFRSKASKKAQELHNPRNKLKLSTNSDQN